MNVIAGYAERGREGEDGHGVDVERDEGTQHEESPHHSCHSGHERQRVQVPVVQQWSLTKSKNNIIKNNGYEKALERGIHS